MSVRQFACCCISCMDRDFLECSNVVSKNGQSKNFPVILMRNNTSSLESLFWGFYGLKVLHINNALYLKVVLKWFLIQEYVDHPVSIRLTLQPQNQRVMCSAVRQHQSRYCSTWTILCSQEWKWWRINNCAVQTNVWWSFRGTQACEVLRWQFSYIIQTLRDVILKITTVYGLLLNFL